MNSELIVRTTLKLSVALNFVGAYLLAFPSSSSGKLVGLPQDAPLLYSSLLSFVVLLFGGIYAWLSRQPNVFQPLLFVGGLGKICFFLIGVYLWFLGDTSGEFTVILIGDFIFGSIWLLALYSNRASKNGLTNTSA